MATRESLKALVTAAENLNSANIVSGGNITAIQLNALVVAVNTSINAVIDAVFNSDNITRLSGTFSAATTFQDNSLIGATLDDILIFIDGNEVETIGYVTSINDTTGTLTFSFPLNGKYKIYNFYNA